MKAWRSYAQTPPPKGRAGNVGGGYWGSPLSPAVKWLLIVNVSLEAIATLGARSFLVEWFGLHPGNILVRPWGLLTYSLLHGGFGHLLVNMLVLFFFGPPLENRWGARGFVWFAAACAAGGALLSFTFMPHTVVGFSGVGYGVMLAFAGMWPNARVFVMAVFPVKAKYLVAGLFLMTALNAGSGAQDGVAHWAHLGGLAAALICLRYSRLGRGSFLAPRSLPTGTVVGGPSTRGFGSGRAGWRSQPGRIWTVRVTRSDPRSRRRSARISSKGRAAAPPERTEEDEALYDRVDDVLDKISARGLESLTSEEKKLLDRMSRRQRSN